MTIEQLQKFCIDDATRPAIQFPFSQDKWTYATNGHIAVRIARIAKVKENQDAPNMDSIFNDKVAVFDDPNRIWVDVPEPIIEINK